MITIIIIPTMHERIPKINPTTPIPSLPPLAQNFIVRQSSKPDTLALSVRLPQDKGPYIQHYLIEIHNQATYSLEASENRFDTPPALIAYYSQCW